MGLRGVRNNWEQLGSGDPLWAVLSLPGKKGGKWDVDEFLATGEREIAAVFAEIERLGAAVEPGRALDFGCGAGRLTQALARRFDQVFGVDIAPAMIEEAERINRRGSRCRFVLNSEPDLAAFPDAHFDFVYSNITLQHMPPRYARRYLNEFLRVLTVGGLAVFQLPSGPRAGVAGTLRRLVPVVARIQWANVRAAIGRPKMQMYWMTQAAVGSSLAPWPYRVLAVSPDSSAGTGWPSRKYFVRREAS